MQQPKLLKRAVDSTANHGAGIATRQATADGPRITRCLDSYRTENVTWKERFCLHPETMRDANSRV